MLFRVWFSEARDFSCLANFVLQALSEVLPDFELQDGASTIHIPKGTYLYFPIWVIQRDTNNFEEPLVFRPERWMVDGSSFNATARSRLLAFSAGGRSCAGEKFARQEMTIVLSTLLKNFKFELLDDYVLTPHRPGVVQFPKGGMPMKISKRMV